MLLDREGSVLLAAAGACEALARRYAHDVDFAQDDSSFKLGARGKTWAELAQSLRERAGDGLSSVATKRTDGYSDEVSNRDAPGTLGLSGRDPWYTQHGRGL